MADNDFAGLIHDAEACSCDRCRRRREDYHEAHREEEVVLRVVIRQAAALAGSFLQPIALAPENEHRVAKSAESWAAEIRLLTTMTPAARCHEGQAEWGRLESPPRPRATQRRLLTWPFILQFNNLLWYQLEKIREI